MVGREVEDGPAVAAAEEDSAALAGAVSEEAELAEAGSSDISKINFLYHTGVIRSNHYTTGDLVKLL